MIRTALALVSCAAGLIAVIPVVLVALPFWLMSAAVRRYAAAVEPRLPEAGELIQFDPVLAWKPRPNLRADYLVPDDDIYRVVTDEDGWPGRVAVGASEMLVVGDSFAYGFGAQPGKVFWDLAPELRIKPVGCPGYDMIQEMLAMREVGAQLAGKLVVWLVYLENDIADSLRPHLLGHRKPFVRRSPITGRWEIVSSHVRPDPWTHSGDGALENMRVLAALCAPGRLADHYYSACRFLIEQAEQTCRRFGADLVVVTVPHLNQLDDRGHAVLRSQGGNPDGFDPDYPDRRLGEICRELGLPFVRGKGCLTARDYKRFERFHWNVRGHRKIAGMLRRLRAAWKSGELVGDARRRASKPAAGDEALAVEYVS